MKHTLVFCMILFSLNGASVDASLKDKQTCSLGIAPRLQAYCLKKAKKEKMRCKAQAGYFKTAFTNSLRFVDSGILNSLLPCLK